MTNSDVSLSDEKSLPFQADVARLLDLMVHAVYSNRDTFLRELISNASDACEKLRFESIQRSSLLEDSETFAIRIALDKTSSRLSVEDNGIGMTRDELVESLGTIANSGTRRYLESLSAAKPVGEGEPGKSAGFDAETLIGQFGIGFYSSFMVAAQVDVASRKAGSDEAWLWSSSGHGEFSVSPLATGDALPRGTRVTLHLSAGSATYLDPHKVEAIVREHSSAISSPIFLCEAPDAAPRKLSDGSALWARSKNTIAEVEYDELYREISGQFDKPAHVIHWRAEGRNEFTALAFIPGSRPLDLFDPDRRSRARLYVRRILINRNSDLLPGWLRFVRLLVDSVDLPLNVSRETVQDSPIFIQIKKAIEGKLLQEFVKLSEESPEKWLRIWNDFGPILKEGLYEDAHRRVDLLKIARFDTVGGEERISLKQYEDELKPNQTAVYYLTGSDLASMKTNPLLEGYKARGIDVLLLPDPIDLFWITAVQGFDGKPFKSVAQGSADIGLIPLTNGEVQADPSLGPQVATLLAFMKQTLALAVADVRASQRLQSSAACLVASDGAIDRRLERIIATQGRAPRADIKPVLEINTHNPLIESMATRFSQSEDKTALSDAVWLILDQARIMDHDEVVDARSFAERLTRILTQAMA